jgi:ABC-type Zn uptake system ZnuABC Zn-binding protein ZnuA
MKSIFLLTLLLFAGSTTYSSIKVVTTLPDLADFARAVGGDRVSVDNIVRGDQNPHYVEVKPSFMLKLRSADIFLMIGMELELWAPQIIDGSRNDRLVVVDLSRQIEKLEIPERVDRSQGDVHRYGNPHYWLDPRNVRLIVATIVTAFSGLSPKDQEYFSSNARAYLERLEGRIVGWEATMKPFAGSKIVTFHKSWSYFTRWLNLVVADQVEPKPGIPPAPGHTAGLIRLVREGGMKVIVVEPFYDTSAPDHIAGKTGARVIRLSTSVGGVPEARDYISLMEYNITTLAHALR